MFIEKQIASTNISVLIYSIIVSLKSPAGVKEEKTACRVNRSPSVKLIHSPFINRFTMQITQRPVVIQPPVDNALGNTAFPGCGYGYLALKVLFCRYFHGFSDLVPVTFVRRHINVMPVLSLTPVFRAVDYWFHWYQTVIARPYCCLAVMAGRYSCYVSVTHEADYWDSFE